MNSDVEGEHDEKKEESQKQKFLLALRERKYTK